MHLPQRMQVGFSTFLSSSSVKNRMPAVPLDVDSVDIGSDKAHHRSAENYLLRGLDEAAALLDNVTEGSADSALEVIGLLTAEPPTVSIRS